MHAGSFTNNNTCNVNASQICIVQASLGQPNLSRKQKKAELSKSKLAARQRTDEVQSLTDQLNEARMAETQKAEQLEAELKKVNSKPAEPQAFLGELICLASSA